MTQYDVFLSHNSADKLAVEELARRLVKAGIQPWLDTWNLIPGEPWQETLEEALDACRTVAVFLGPSGIGPWQNEEMRAAIYDGPLFRGLISAEPSVTLLWRPD